jgi:broad specificity phosphatase PhoE
MTLIPNAANLAADGDGGLAISAGRLRGAFRRLFAADWTERWMVVANDHAVATLSRDAGGFDLSWFDRADLADHGMAKLTPRSDASLADLHQEIARKLHVPPRRIAFLPIGE